MDGNRNRDFCLLLTLLVRCGGRAEKRFLHFLFCNLQNGGEKPIDCPKKDRPFSKKRKKCRKFSCKTCKKGFPTPEKRSPKRRFCANCTYRWEIFVKILSKALVDILCIFE